MSLSEKEFTDKEAELLQKIALVEEEWGAIHPDIALLLNKLVILHMEESHYAQAEPLLIRMFAMNEQIFGAQHINTLTGLHHLLKIYSLQSKKHELRSLYTNALTILRKIPDVIDPELAVEIYYLAFYCLKNKCINAETEFLFFKNLSIHEHTFGVEHPDVDRCRFVLASFFQNQRKYSEAGAIYERNLAIREQRAGLNDPSVITDRINLAKFYQEHERVAEAESLLRMNLVCSEMLNRKKHIHLVIQSIGALSHCYLSQGKYTEAVPHLLQMLNIVVRRQPKYMVLFSILLDIKTIEHAYYTQGKITEANALYTNVLDIAKTTRGKARQNLIKEIKQNHETSRL